ncbi:MAG TPA: HdeD family acid-resistance protein, partial [Gammaproteobacteria bacterium]|nr:HdeD family acid-resistance protein [Gammaproteobacteria bacterium]
SIRRHWLGYMIQAGLMGLGGILAVAYPLLRFAGVASLLGWILILSGLAQGISLFGARQVPNFWIQLISVALSVLIGWLFLLRPQEGLGALSLLLTVFFMVEGISRLVFSLTIRPLPNWYWVLASGILGLLLAALLLWSLPVSKGWVLGVMLGVQLLAEGGALGYLAWHCRAGGTAYAG